MNDSKVASNEMFLKMLEGIPADDFKKALIESIKKDGMTFRQRDYVDDVAKKAMEAMLAEEEAGRDDAFRDAWNSYDWNSPIDSDGVPG